MDRANASRIYQLVVTRKFSNCAIQCRRPAARTTASSNRHFHLNSMNSRVDGKRCDRKKFKRWKTSSIILTNFSKKSRIFASRYRLLHRENIIVNAMRLCLGFRCLQLSKESAQAVMLYLLLHLVTIQRSYSEQSKAQTIVCCYLLGSLMNRYASSLPIITSYL